MDLAGNLIQSLSKFLNIDHLVVRLIGIAHGQVTELRYIPFFMHGCQSTAHFPDVTKEISQLFDRINGFQSTYTQLTFDITQKKNMAKNLLLRAEDSRLYNE